MPVARLMCLSLLLTAAAAAGDRGLLLSGKILSGTVVEVSADKVVFRAADGATQAALVAELRHIDLGDLPPTDKLPACHQVELSDGSVLQCVREDGVRLEGGKVRLRLLGGQQVDVPLGALSYVLKDAHLARNRDHREWKKALALRARHDCLLIWREDVLNRDDGLFAETGQGTVLEFKSESGRVRKPDLANPACFGWTFFQRPTEQPAVVCRLLDVNHHVIAVARLELRDERFLVATPAGVQLSCPRGSVARLDFSKGKFEYLADLKPAAIDREPGSDRLWRYQFHAEAAARNRNLDGGPLQFGGRKFDKGLSLPAPTTLRYNLDGNFREFSAVLGVNDLVPGQGRVRVTIEGDGKALGMPVQVQRGDLPRAIRCSVLGVHQLRIIVESPGLLDYGNHVDIAEAAVTK